MELNKIIHGEALEQLRLLPAESVDCVVTSTPYWNKRDYDNRHQIGLERLPEDFIQKLVLIFREAARVMKSTGTLWINIGDSYAAAGKKRTRAQAIAKSGLNGSLENQAQSLAQKNKIVGGLKAKDLVGIPWMLAFALRQDGWFLRQDIIWSKPNGMPESVRDRCTMSHEYIFLLTKSKKYHYDYEAIKTKMKDTSIKRLSQDIENQIGSDRVPGKTNGTMKAVGKIPLSQTFKRQNSKREAVMPNQSRGTHRPDRKHTISDGKANKRSVWNVATKPFKKAHFAVMPEALIVDCIKAGCPPCGVVLDPFFGAGTTGVVAIKLDRNFVGIELNETYIKDIAQPRIDETIKIHNLKKAQQPLFGDESH